MKKIHVVGTFDFDGNVLTEDEEDTLIDEGGTAIYNIILFDEFENKLPEKVEILDITLTDFEAELYFDTDMEDVKIKRKLMAQELNFSLNIKSMKIIDIRGVENE